MGATASLDQLRSGRTVELLTVIYLEVWLVYLWHNFTLLCQLDELGNGIYSAI